MEAIGGYFELADYEEGGIFPHQGGILLNTGRNAFEYILRSIGEVKSVYLPYYTCEVIFEPLKRLHIPWVFYHVNSRLEIDDEIHPKDGEYLIANNYYGIKDAYIKSLVNKYGNHLIVDCAQAFFAKPIPSVKCFYSTRKYVGVADGGVAYLGDLQEGMVSIYETEFTADHDSHLFKRKQFGAEAGFADYQANELKLANQPIRWMSDITKSVLYHVDYEKIVAQRRENYNYLHKSLADKNILDLPSFDTFVCPMVYPFVTRIDRNLRKEMIDNKVFVAKYWPNVLQMGNFETEFDLANRVIPIPVDQRYGTDEMKRIIKIINNNN